LDGRGFPRSSKRLENHFMSPARKYIIVALVSGVVAFALSLFLQGKRGQQALEARQRAGELATVIVAGEDIPLGTRLTNEHLAEATFLASSLPAGSTAMRDAVVGHIALVPLVADEPVLESKLFSPTKEAGIPAAFVPEGRYAYALEMKPEDAVGGAIGRTDHIDVISATDEGGEILLEDVMVLGIAGEFPFGVASGDSGGDLGILGGSSRQGIATKILILDLTQEQVVLLATAVQQTDVSVALHPMR